jgi:pimeloyl-ACP methyl ester carboxylesterase
MRRRLTAALAVVLLVAGCTGDAGDGARPGGSGAPPATLPATLGKTEPCAGIDGFACGDLVVPLDRGGKVPGELTLRVAVADNADAPRGTLLMLTGGPGQPGVSFVPRLRQRIGYLLDDYRLVMIDQRGTGATAIDCPKLQNEVGWSDVTPPSPGAVQECADLIGSARDFYTTADTVADLDALRAALGVDTWAISGVSYGSFVAARYGLTFPERASRLVLDSVVQQDGAPALYTEGFARAAHVLRTACEEQSCGYDPAQELADVVRRHGNGVGVFDLLVIASISDPRLRGTSYYPVLKLLHQAAQGDVGPLNQAIDDLRSDPAPAGEFSSGLHAATLCADQADLPWRDPAAPTAGRPGAVQEAVAALPADAVWPFTPQDAGGQGLVQTCVPWPPTRQNPEPPHRTLTMPVLLLAGDRDLSTPLAWAQEQAAMTPKGELVVVEGMGHSIQGRHPVGDAAVRRFLLG